MPLLSTLGRVLGGGVELTVFRLDVTMYISIQIRKGWLARPLCHDSACIRQMVKDFPDKLFGDVSPDNVNAPYCFSLSLNRSTTHDLARYADISLCKLPCSQ